MSFAKNQYIILKEEIVRIKTSVPNDKLEMIKEVENHFESEFGNLERLYRKVETI